jgi:putative component of toxin-antitoxin plasmid stabilization module
MPTIPPPATDEWADPADGRHARAFVMAELRRIAETGGATVRPTDGGVVELRLLTGEIFLLGDERIVRLA